MIKWYHLNLDIISLKSLGYIIYNTLIGMIGWIGRLPSTASHSSALICPPLVHVHELFSKWNFVLTKKLASTCLESKCCSLFSSFRFFMDSLSAKLFSFINFISSLLGIIAFIDLHSLIWVLMVVEPTETHNLWPSSSQTLLEHWWNVTTLDFKGYIISPSKRNIFIFAVITFQTFNLKARIKAIPFIEFVQGER